MEEKSKFNLSFNETAFIKTNKHFDEVEKNVIINYSNIDNNFVDNFFNYYLRERPALLSLHEIYMKKFHLNLSKSPSFHNPSYAQTRELLIKDPKLGNQIHLINEDIRLRLKDKDISIISVIKSKFQLHNNTNIDIIGYKFILLFEKSETKKTIKGQIYIEIAKELSLLLNKENEYIDFEEYCKERFQFQHIQGLRRDYVNDIKKVINEKATEKADKELFPNKSRIDYDEFSNKISKYIQGGTREIYKYIIENKKFPDDKNIPPLRMLSNKNADIVRFADAFEIPLRDASKIFGTLVVSKERSPNARTEFYFFLKAYCPNLYAEKIYLTK